MQPAAASIDSTRLRELCGELEQILLATLVPPSLFHGSIGADESNDGFLASGCQPALFTQAFAAALERGGGLGLGAELSRLLAEGGR